MCNLNKSSIILPLIQLIHADFVQTREVMSKTSLCSSLVVFFYLLLHQNFSLLSLLLAFPAASTDLKEAASHILTTLS